MSGGFGSGRWKKRGRRTIDSCPALDVNRLAAKGWLQPGGSGTCPLTFGNEIVLISLHAEAEQLYISWRPVCRLSGEPLGEREGAREGEQAGMIIISIARVPRYFGGTRPYFVCPGGSRKDDPRRDGPRRDGPRTAPAKRSGETDVEFEAGGTDAGIAETGVSGTDTAEVGGADAGISETGASGTDTAEVGTGGTDASGVGGAAGCGRRVTKLYFSYGRFLCRHCSQLVYASRYEQQPWLRAYRRASKLRQRLDSIGRRMAEKPRSPLVEDYKHLLEATLQAETLATEAGTARLLQLATGIERRRKVQFTL